MALHSASRLGFGVARVSGPQAVRGFAARHEQLHDSYGEIDYEPRPRSGEESSAADSAPRPLARDPAVRSARAAAAHSLSEPEVLGNSLSGAEYPLPRITGSRLAALSSVADPEYRLGNSMSQGDYMIPSTLRSSSLRTLRAQGFGARSLAPVTMQRVIVASRATTRSYEPLHDSFSSVDYREQR